MKGVNAIENTNDPGKDGFAPATGVNNPNTIFGKDLVAFSLQYFNGDYQAINSATPFASVNTSSYPATNSSELFNGNIRYMQTRLTNPTTLAAMPMLNAYKYDQLNRLKESRSYETGLTSNVWNPTTYGDSYYNAFEYDAMGNILTQKRHKRDGTKIEDLSYVYHTSGGKLVRNRLYHLDDVVGSGVDATDIDDMGTYDADAQDINTLNNYVYDEEGRLSKDIQEGISKIVWRVDGKVKEIQRASGTSKWLRFDYDGIGRRIAKHVYSNNGSTHEKSIYYILDAKGKQICTYDYEISGGSAKFNLKERDIIGVNRIGSKQDSMNLLTATLTQNYIQVLGTKYYEFSNHLGNVLTVFSDLKVALDTDANNVVDGYKLQILNTSDYSPFGVQLDGRTLSFKIYKFGYQGSEKDDEVKGAGNSYTTFYRLLDPRVGRWFSLDPKAKELPFDSPYVSMQNSPIGLNDVLGDKPTPKEAALMSKHVYGDKVNLKGGWKVSSADLGDKYAKEDNSGFKYEIYERTKKNGKTEYCVAFAGTEDWADVGDDLSQPLGSSKQFDLAIKYTKQIEHILPGKEISYTGHSLGGGLATAAALKHDKAAITFNPSWLGTVTLTKYGLWSSWYSNDKIDNYVVNGEILDASMKALMLQTGLVVPTGKTHYLHTIKTYIFPQDIFFAHSIDFLIWELRDVDAYNKVYNKKTGKNEVDK